MCVRARTTVDPSSWVRVHRPWALLKEPLRAIGRIRGVPVDFWTFAGIIAAILASLLAGFAAGRFLTSRELEWGFREREEAARQDATRRSRSVLRGRFLEELAPRLPGFPYDPTEIRFIGTPVDYVVFRGLSAGRVEEVVFLEVKSGTSHLSRVQRDVRDAVEAGAIVWDEYRIIG